MDNTINPNEEELLQSLDGDIKMLKKELNETRLNGYISPYEIP